MAWSMTARESRASRTSWVSLTLAAKVRALATATAAWAANIVPFLAVGIGEGVGPSGVVDGRHSADRSASGLGRRRLGVGRRLDGDGLAVVR